MRNGWTVPAWLGLCALLCAGACGEKDAPVAPPGDEDDASIPQKDAGEERDAADDDAGGEPDAGAPEDDAGALSQCEGDVLEFPAANAPGRPFSAVQQGNVTRLVYLVAAGGGSLGSATAQGLRHVSFETTGDPDEPEDVVNVGLGSYARTRDPALVARGEALELFYTSNQDGVYELYRMDLSTPGAAAVRETSNVDRNEFGPVAAWLGDAAAVVYSDEPAARGVPGVLALKFAGDAPSELSPESLGMRASQLAFAELGAGGAVAFVSHLDGGAGIHLQSVAADGTPRGELSTLTERIGGASSVDLVQGRQGAAAVYTEVPSGVVHQLRFRKLDAEGKPIATARALTTANQDLREVAIAPYSQGYVVAYRRIGGVGPASASIFLMFIDGEGNVGGTRLVRAATPSGGGIDVLVANDGRLIVIWADTQTVTNASNQRTETELRVRAARLLCAL